MPLNASHNLLSFSLLDLKHTP